MEPIAIPASVWWLLATLAIAFVIVLVVIFKGK
jgi:hypothetical protein